LLDFKFFLVLPCYATLHLELAWSLEFKKKLGQIFWVFSGKKLGQFLGVFEWEVGGHK
jgi:hypothetical protein